MISISGADLIGATALAVGLISAATANDDRLRQLSIVGAALWGGHWMLIGAFTAAVITGVALARHIAAYALRHHGVELRDRMAIGFSLLGVVLGVVTWQGPVSLLPITASLASTWAAFRLSGIRLRLGHQGVNTLWLANAACLGSVTGMLSSCLLILSVQFGIFRLRRTAAA